MNDKREELEPVRDILPRVLARIPGMGAYLRKQEEQERGMVVTDLDQWFDADGEGAA